MKAEETEYKSALADQRKGVSDLHPLLGPIFFFFMQVSEKNGQIRY